jgi:hypothetical protein
MPSVRFVFITSSLNAIPRVRWSDECFPPHRQYSVAPRCAARRDWRAARGNDPSALSVSYLMLSQPPRAKSTLAQRWAFATTRRTMCPAGIDDGDICVARDRRRGCQMVGRCFQWRICRSHRLRYEESVWNRQREDARQWEPARSEEGCQPGSRLPVPGRLALSRPQVSVYKEHS